MTFDDIRENFKEGKYKKPKMRKRERKTLPDNYVFDENLSVAANRKKVEKYNDKARLHNALIWDEFQKKEKAVYLKLFDDVVSAVQNELDISKELSKTLVREIKSGYFSIFEARNYIEEYCEFLKPFLEYAREHSIKK